MNGAAETAQLAREALIRLEPRFGGAPPASAVLRSWAGEASAVLAGMLQDPASRGNGESLLARADELLAAIRADALADGSDLLPSGLTRRLASLAGTLRAVLAGAPPANPDLPWLPGAALADVERAWTRVATHRLADADERTPAFHAAVRLARWLAGNSAVGSASLQALLDRHGDSDAWVDSAVNDAAPGVSDPDLGAGLAAVLAAVRARRAAHDTAFAAALAAHTSDDPGAVSGTHAGRPAPGRPPAHGGLAAGPRRPGPAARPGRDERRGGHGGDHQRAGALRRRLDRGAAARAEPAGRRAGRAAHPDRGQPRLAARAASCVPAARTPNGAATTH